MDAVAANVLNRQFGAMAPNQKWIADFTNIWTAEGWLNVAAVIDLFSRRVVSRRFLESTLSDAIVASRAPGRLPWDFHPALTEERLRVCARLLADARRDAVALAAYELGDDNWSVGCRAYAFGKQRLERVAEFGVHALAAHHG